MSDAPIKTGRVRKLISLKQQQERSDWARSLGCTEDEVQEAVRTVGRSAEAVRLYLVARRGGTG